MEYPQKNGTSVAAYKEWIIARMKYAKTIDKIDVLLENESEIGVRGKKAAEQLEKEGVVQIEWKTLKTVVRGVWGKENGRYKNVLHWIVTPGENFPY